MVIFKLKDKKYLPDQFYNWLYERMKIFYPSTWKWPLSGRNIFVFLTLIL